MEAFMEDYPGSGSGSSYSSGGCFMGGMSSQGKYSSNHNPFVYFTQDIVNNTRRCSRILPGQFNHSDTNSLWHGFKSGTVETDDLFLKELSNATSAANYVFLTPNSIDDLHDCGDVSLGNYYLQRLIPQILNSALFTQKGQHCLSLSTRLLRSSARHQIRAVHVHNLGLPRSQH